MRYVLDASVIVKWVLWDKPTELHVQQALRLLGAALNDEISLLQPSHWLAEVAGAVIRLRPEVALRSIDTLHAMSIQTIDSLQVFITACELANKLNHHLFDTLYHAIALCHKNVQLITADEHYYRKAVKQGNIRLLADFNEEDF
jgi:predicted nucleic acid-binding protein